MTKFKNPLILIAFFILSSFLQAQTQTQTQTQVVTVSNAWARASVKGQNATGVFMSLKSPVHTKLIGVSTSVAKVSQVHQMSMDNNVMKMSALQNGLELNAGSLVELKPGGYHIMLVDLQKVLEKDSKIDVQLTFLDDSGKKTRMDVSVPVLLQAPMEEGAHTHSMPMSMHGQEHQHHQ